MLESFARAAGRRLWLFAFFVPLAFFLLTLNGAWSSDYPASILGMQYAMWADHSFSLGTASQLLVRSVDLASYQGRYYSAISPGFAILAFPFAALGFVLDGNTLNVWGHALLMDEAFLALASSVAVLLVYVIARFYASPVPSLLASLTLAFATPLWPSTTVVFVHGASLMFVTASIYFLLRRIRGGRGLENLLVSGVFMGLAGFVEYAALLLVLPTVGYLLVRGRKRALPLFLGGFSIGPLAQLAYNVAAFGNVLTFPEQLKVGASDGLLSRFNPLGALGHAAMYLVSPYRGILFFSPVLALGFYSLYRMTKSRGLREDALLFISAFLVVAMFYSSWGDWAGGLAYGPRFLILTLPYLVVPIALLIESSPSRRLRLLFIALFGISSFIEGTGALTTAFSVSGGIFTYQPLVLNIPWLIQGRLDSWWLTALGLSDGLAPQMFASVIFLILWSFASIASGAALRPLGGRARAELEPRVRFAAKGKTMAKNARTSKT